ncbi:MAG: SDR family NAD(P)-dependent oxidoreductase [Pirellulales bacterium]|nr:SDR family NAD(P)-dependent oxidoreductase [Pirellulales bacterium]
MSYWHGKVVVVTGASSGLGRALAAAFAAMGATVVLAARGAEALAAAAAEISAAGGNALHLIADVTVEESVTALFDEVRRRLGRLDVLVNNAGRSMRRAIQHTTPEDFRDLLELNLLGVVRCTRAALPMLLESRGHLVNIGSLAGKAAARYIGAYPASKFAVTAYTQQLRLELGPQGLHVLLVCPGPIARPQQRSYAEPTAHGDDLERLPPAARLPGAGTKVRPIAPERLAAAIVRACEKRQCELIWPPIARWLFAVQQLSPRLGDWLIRKLT